MVGINHAFVTAKIDGADDTLVRANEWNSDHVVTGDVDFGGFAIDNASLTACNPPADGGAALGSSSLQWSGAYLSGPINFNNSDVVVTPGTNSLTFSGASVGYFYDAPIRTTYTSGGTNTTIDASDQAGITLATGTSTQFCPGGQGMLTLVLNLTSVSVAFVIAGGGFITSISVDASHWELNTTTPTAGKSSLTFDAGVYKIYNNVGATRTYNIFSIRLD